MGLTLGLYALRLGQAKLRPMPMPMPIVMAMPVAMHMPMHITSSGIIFPIPGSLNSR